MGQKSGRGSAKGLATWNSRCWPGLWYHLEFFLVCLGCWQNPFLVSLILCCLLTGGPAHEAGWVDTANKGQRSWWRSREPPTPPPGWTLFSRICSVRRTWIWSTRSRGVHLQRMTFWFIDQKIQLVTWNSLIEADNCIFSFPRIKSDNLNVFSFLSKAIHIHCRQRRNHN